METPRPMPFIWLVLVLLAGCANGLTVAPTETPPPTSPPPTIETFTACGFTIVHPSNFVPDEPSTQVMFQSTDDPFSWAIIQLRRRAADEINLPLPDLAVNLQIKYFPTLAEPPTNAFVFTAPDGQRLRGMQSDVIHDDLHTRLLTLLRPNGVLQDGQRADVIYEIVFETPQVVWSVWEPLFETMMQTFQPTDCP